MYGILEQFEKLGAPPEILTQIKKVTAEFDCMAYEKKRIQWDNETEGNLQGLDCRKCRNKGYIAYLNETGETIHKECECMIQRRTLQRMERSGLGKLLQKYTFENYETPEIWQKIAKERAEEFAENPDGWFYIGGQTGAGKTHLCTAICQNLMKKGLSVRYLIWRELLHQLESNRFKEEGLEDIMDEIRTVDVLYLDDFLKAHGDKNKLSGALDYAFEIINTRYNADKITIISSEWMVDELQQLAGATAGRIVEMTGRHLVQVKRDPSRNHRLQDFI